MPLRKSKRYRKYHKIVKESLEGFHQGFSHRDHRTKKDKTGKEKTTNLKKYFTLEEQEKEWKEIKKKINIINR